MNENKSNCEERRTRTYEGKKEKRKTKKSSDMKKWENGNDERYAQKKKNRKKGCELMSVTGNERIGPQEKPRNKNK